MSRGRSGRLARASVIAVLGLVAVPGAARADSCPVQPVTDVFAAFGDVNDYFLAPGGSFEGRMSWSTSGDAGRENDAEPAPVGGSVALRLDDDSSATSPPFCVDAAHPKLRFFLKGETGLLTVDALRENGSRVNLYARAQLGDQDWTLSPELVLAGKLGLEADDREQIRLRFTSRHGQWLVDAVYIDPYVRR